MAAMENNCHRAMTILKDEEERKKEIKGLKKIARTNGYQPEEVDRVMRKMSARKGRQNTPTLKYSGAILHMGNCTDKVNWTYM